MFRWVKKLAVLLDGSRSRKVAIIQSLIATCRLHEVSTFDYLVDVLQRIGVHPATEVHLLTRLWKAHFAANPFGLYCHGARDRMRIIEDFSLEQLIELNRLICERIAELRAQQDFDVLMQLRLGQQVHFESQRGPVFGRVIKINRKTVIIRCEDNRRVESLGGIGDSNKDCC